jgi:hypothetical protein
MIYSIVPVNFWERCEFSTATFSLNLNIVFGCNILCRKPFLFLLLYFFAVQNKGFNQKKEECEGWHFKTKNILMTLQKDCYFLAILFACFDIVSQKGYCYILSFLNYVRNTATQTSYLKRFRICLFSSVYFVFTLKLW